ncbi:MAG: hypothetical protein ACJ8AV_02800 [Gemmatimonadales bacterium]
MNAANAGAREKKPLPTVPTFLTVLTLLPFLTACYRSPEKQQEQLRQELKSWDATARLTHELSERGALPGVYLRQISEAIEQGKQKVRQQAAKSAQ